MTVTEKLNALRSEMKKNQIDAYYIPTNDYHGSEYIGDYFKCREYISGFTGSAGDLIVTEKEAGLWTDGRYYLQAEDQLKGTGITLYRQQEEGVPEPEKYLEQKLQAGQTLGFDGKVVKASFVNRLSGLEARQIEINSSLDLIGTVWKDRPELKFNPAFILEGQYAGVSREEKIKWVYEWMKRQETDFLVLTSLDDIAWLLNIRGSDIRCNPVVLSYMVIGRSERILFGREESFSQEITEALSLAEIERRDYEAIYEYLGGIPAQFRIAMDFSVINYTLLQSVNSMAEVIDTVSPTVLMKAIKNPVEVANVREAHIRDGVAVTKFIYWLKQNIEKIPLTEISVSKKLEEFREAQKHYMGPSFDPIAGYAEHGAIVHYSATPESDKALQPENFLLMDTGAHYLEGTTDITRTIWLGGDANSEQKQYYTAVLRGNLALCGTKFKYGCSGVSLDCLARLPLWELGCDYNHGTGHGVGYLLNVHEKPNAFRYQIASRSSENAVMEEGMITSNEPGIYLEGKYGIRLENLIVCIKREKTRYGQFMGFEPLTMVPFERGAIEPTLMSDHERRLLNKYHEQVYRSIAPYLERNEEEWLADICAPV